MQTRAFESSVNKIELKGNDAQVRWAKTIRLQQFQFLRKMQLKELLYALKPYLSDETLASIKCKTPNDLVQFAWVVLRQMFQHDDALWWIQKKSETLYEWLPWAVPKAIDWCKANKKFR